MLELRYTQLGSQSLPQKRMTAFFPACSMSSCFVNTEWEAAKNAEPIKEPPSQAVSVEVMAAPIQTHAETYSQQVTMMPVQVRKIHQRRKQIII